MKKKDERIIPVPDLGDPEKLMPDPRKRKESLKEETKEPEIEAVKVPQMKLTKANKYRR